MSTSIKYALITFVFISQNLFGQVSNGTDTVSFYQGGREMYSTIKLALLSDSTYQYYSWMKGGAEISDLGEWKMLGSYLILNSTSTETTSKIRLTKKEQKRQDKVYKVEKEYLPRFETDTFRLEDSKLMLYDETNIEEEDKPFNIRYLTLYKK